MTARYSVRLPLWSITLKGHPNGQVRPSHTSGWPKLVHPASKTRRSFSWGHSAQASCQAKDGSLPCSAERVSQLTAVDLATLSPWSMTPGGSPRRAGQTKSPHQRVAQTVTPNSPFIHASARVSLILSKDRSSQSLAGYLWGSRPAVQILHVCSDKLTLFSTGRSALS